MDITIRADAKEIASLVLELQGKPGKTISIAAPTITTEEREILAKNMRAILLEQSQGHKKGGSNG